MGGSNASSSNDGNSASALKDRASIQDLIPHLYPQSSSTGTDVGLDGGDSGGWFGGISKTADKKSSRFSTLLLEHGEEFVQDWAVVAYSAPWKAGLAAAMNSTNTIAPSVPSASSNIATNNNSPASSNAENQIQWAQAPQTSVATLAGGKDGQAATAAHKRNLRNMSSNLSTTSHAAIRSVSDITKDEFPTVHMNKIEGRLYLCSRSLVFEPLDTSRGVIRCPWSKMSVLTSVENDEWSVQVYSNRHSVCKINNVVAPFESVSIPSKIRFCFLHSKPQPMMGLAQRLFAAANNKGIRTMATTAAGNAEVELHAYQKEQRQQQQQRAPAFDMDNLVDVVREQLLLPPIPARIMTPLQSQAGVLVATSAERIYFQPTRTVIGNDESATAQRAIRWKCADIVATARRYNGLRDSSLEIYWQPSSTSRSSSGRGRRSKDNIAKSTLIAFDRRHDREQVLSLLPLRIPCLTDREFLTNVVQEWWNGRISNYDYLLALNSAAGRSFHDLSRYPVFPWVLKNYDGEELPELDSPDSFRDLAKPVGALNPKRLEYFQQRMANMQDVEKDMFLYGTHYSAPAYVLYWLVRTMPEHMLCLQNGKFDAADRMFFSMNHSYQCCLTNHADVKELIPQFYSLDKFDVDFLTNAHALTLGATQTGERVHDVVLPPWANDSPKRFVQTNRKALESTYCTQQLPAWVDLIFGCRSRGEAAKEANNLFHRMSYLGPRELADASAEERATAELQATEFGIVPDQLFQQAHPLPKKFQSDVVGELDDAAMESLLDPQVGRASSSSSGADGREAWELLDAPPLQEDVSASKEETAQADSNLQNNSSEKLSSDLEIAQNRTLPLRGSGETPSSLQVETTMNPFDSADIQHSSRPQATNPSAAQKETKVAPTKIHVEPTPSKATWDMKMLERRQIHSDAVSGISLMLLEVMDDQVLSSDNKRRSLLATTSLDGGLMVHKVSLSKPTIPADTGRSAPTDAFSSTFTRFSYSSILSGRGTAENTTSSATNSGNQLPQNTNKLTEYRTHSSRDPLASLVVASDEAEGYVAFAGGHDDVVLAYGINSACAVASVYSHRDAVTGLDLLQRRPSDITSALWLESATHVMVSGSWDATVKVWSACVSGGEAVAIHREPLAELFDADSSIVSVSVAACPPGGKGGDGLMIAAGCADGSFNVWNIHTDGFQVLVHKEPSKRGAGPCSAVQWVQTVDGGLHLFCSFSTGKVAAYSLADQSSRLVSAAAVSVGVAILSMIFSEGVILVGCADGGLRLIPVTYRLGSNGMRGFHFDSKPTMWKAVNSKSAPGICSIAIGYTTTKSQDGQSKRRCICCTGAEDGSVAMFELKLAL